MHTYGKIPLYGQLISLRIYTERRDNMIADITVNEQSSIRIAGDKIIYFDPLHISGEPHDADIIFITHDHFDHFSPEDIAKCAKEGTRYVAPYTMTKAFTKAEIGENMTTFMHAGYSAEVEGIPIDAIAAYNLLKPFHPKKSGWLGYVITVGGKRVYVCGDTDATPEAKEVECDIICVPVGGTYVMNPKQAAELVDAVKPEIAVPTHYGTMSGRPTDGDTFAAAVTCGAQIVKKLP